MTLASPSPEEDVDTDDVAWITDQRWQATRDALMSTLQLSDQSTWDTLLVALPQLLRLETSVVADAAETLVEQFGNVEQARRIIHSQPGVLGYARSQITQGVEFLETMMGGVPTPTVVQACALSPDLLILGISEGIKTQRIASALGSASVSSSATAKGVVRDISHAMNRRLGRGGD